jgi:hypothetical protein
VAAQPLNVAPLNTLSREAIGDLKNHLTQVRHSASVVAGLQLSKS